MSTVSEAATTVHCDTTAWATAVRRVSEQAQARLPEALHGRIQRATALVLSGGVHFEDDGHTCQVRASDGRTWYSANGACPCPDHHQAPGHLCKHRLARGMYLRAGALLREGLPATAAPIDADTLAPTAAATPSGIPAQDWAPLPGERRRHAGQRDAHGRPAFPQGLPHPCQGPGAAGCAGHRCVRPGRTRRRLPPPGHGQGWSAPGPRGERHA